MRTSPTKYIPTPFRPGYKILRKYTEQFEDRVGNKAELTLIDYVDKKGKEVLRYVFTIKWEEKYEYN